MKVRFSGSMEKTQAKKRNDIIEIACLKLEASAFPHKRMGMFQRPSLLDLVAMVQNRIADQDARIEELTDTVNGWKKRATKILDDPAGRDNFQVPITRAWAKDLLANIRDYDIEATP